MNDQDLFDAADDARRRSHSPYSGFRVGAAVCDDRGRVYLGCNVENASYPEGLCAEANAIGSMVADGGRYIRAIAVVGAVEETANTANRNPFSAIGACMPCGGCRQRILEFADGDTRILLRNADGTTFERRIEDLLPESFRT